MEEESAGQGAAGVAGIRSNGDEPPTCNLSEDVLEFVHNDSSFDSKDKSKSHKSKEKNDQDKG